MKKPKRSIPATGVGAKILFCSYRSDKPMLLDELDATGIIVSFDPNDRITFRHFLRKGTYKFVKLISRHKDEWKYKYENPS